jgi:hypothetical protein
LQRVNELESQKKEKRKTPWPESESELYRPSDRRLPVESCSGLLQSVPASLSWYRIAQSNELAFKWCHVHISSGIQSGWFSSVTAETCDSARLLPRHCFVLIYIIILSLHLMIKFLNEN